MFHKHAGRERPKTLAELDLQVHGCLHPRRTRIAQDAPGPERTGTKLHTALEPTHHLLVRQQLRGVIEKFSLVWNSLVRRVRLLQEALDLAGAKPRSQQTSVL